MICLSYVMITIMRDKMEKLWMETNEDTFDGEKVLVRPICPICHQPMSMYNVSPHGEDPRMNMWMCDNDECQKLKQLLE